MYRLMGRVPGLSVVVILRTVFWGCAVTVGSFPVPHLANLLTSLACLSLGNIISKGQSSLQRDRCVGGMN